MLDPFENYNGFVLKSAVTCQCHPFEISDPNSGSRLCFVSARNPVVSVRSLRKLHTFQIGKYAEIIHSLLPFPISVIGSKFKTFVCTLLVYKIKSTIRPWTIPRSNSEKRLQFQNQINLFRNIKTRETQRQELVLLVFRTARLTNNLQKKPYFIFFNLISL